MQHANSTLTPKGRHRMVLLVEEERVEIDLLGVGAKVAGGA
jgi:hypothetical protein